MPPRIPRIEGAVSPGFEPVRAVFADNFARRGERGGAVCVYLDGERVVDLWGGVADPATGALWRPDTMVAVHSATKGTNRMGMQLSGDWRDRALRAALDRCLAERGVSADRAATRPAPGVRSSSGAPPGRGSPTTR